jgi:cyclopropane fatty-acyl-phospholipid synthase-like methyltransferase
MDDANSMAFFQTAKALTHARLALQPGEAVLDIGCGSGGDVRAMARSSGRKDAPSDWTVARRW